MDEIITHAHLAQVYKSDPREIVQRLMGMWKRFSLLRDEWELSGDFAIFCSRHNLVSWVEALLGLDISSKEVFNLFVFLYFTKNAALVELVVKHQLSHSRSSAPSYKLQDTESYSTSRLLFDIVESQWIDLVDQWCVGCEALRSRGAVSDEQIIQTLQNPDNNDEDSAFFKVCRKFRFPMINAFLDINLDYSRVPGVHDRTDKDRMTPLHHLSRYPRLDSPENDTTFTAIFSRLARHTVDVNLLDSQGNTPLHNLCRAQHLRHDAIGILLGRGADPNICDELGQTPLHVLCNVTILRDRRFLPSVLKMMFSAGADPNLPDKTGRSPFHYVLFGAHGSSVLDLEHRLSLLKCLIDAGFNVQAADSLGRTALHEAADIKDPRALKLLTQAGANVNARENHQETPLQLIMMGATISTRTELRDFLSDDTKMCIKELLTAGADLAVKGQKRKTFMEVLLSVEKSIESEFQGHEQHLMRLRWHGIADLFHMHASKHPDAQPQ